jgi:AcrR family transcriptional regulator
MNGRRGPKAQRGEVAETILAQARGSFADHGYAATTLQGVARAAGVDTKLVRYYFTSKEALLEACLVAPDELIAGVRALAGVPIGQRGEAIVRTHLAAWANPAAARVMRTSLLIAGHEQIAMARVRAIFADGLIPAATVGLPPDEVPTRGGLITSQLLGLALARFIYAIDQTTGIADDEIVRAVGATIQRYLNGPL